MMIAVISLLTVALIYSSTLTLDVSALMQQVSKVTCDSLTKAQDVDYKNECCWTERDDGTGGGTAGEEQITCCRQKRSDNSIDCTSAPTSGPPLPTGDLPQLETVPPIRGLPRGGDVPTLEQVPQPGLQPGSDIPTLEQGPGFNQGTEGEPPLPVICSEEAGLEKDPETGQCVPIESPVTEEQPEEAPEEEPEEEEQPEPEEEQSSEESDSEDNGNN